MVQRYTQTNSGGICGGSSFGGVQPGFPGWGYCSLEDSVHAPYHGGYSHEQRFAPFSKESELSRTSSIDRKVGGAMLSVTGINRFYYIPGFTDMRCKHSRILSIIREQLRREPDDGDVFIVMSKDRRIVRMFTYDNRSYSLFEKKFVSGYQFMKVTRNGEEKAYRIDWKDVVLLLENPIVKELKIR